MNSKFISKMFIVGCVFLCGSAYASDWVVIAESHGSVVQPNCKWNMTVDTSFVSAKNNVVSAWSEVNFGPNNKSCPNERVKKFRSLSQIDCAEHKIRTLHASAVFWDDHAISSEMDGDWKYVMPNSRDAKLAGFVCRNYQ